MKTIEMSEFVLIFIKVLYGPKNANRMHRFVPEPCMKNQFNPGVVVICFLWLCPEKTYLRKEVEEGWKICWINQQETRENLLLVKRGTIWGCT